MRCRWLHGGWLRATSVESLVTDDSLHRHERTQAAPCSSEPDGCAQVKDPDATTLLSLVFDKADPERYRWRVTAGKGTSQAVHRKVSRAALGENAPQRTAALQVR